MMTTERNSITLDYCLIGGPLVALPQLHIKNTDESTKQILAFAKNDSTFLRSLVLGISLKLKSQVKMVARQFDVPVRTP